MIRCRRRNVTLTLQRCRAAPARAIAEAEPVDTRNMILAVVLSVSIMIGYQVFFAPSPPPVVSAAVL